jgi:hypothetical protein
LGGCFANTSFALFQIENGPSGFSLLDELRRFYIVGLVGQVISLLSIVSGLRRRCWPSTCKSWGGERAIAL